MAAFVNYSSLPRMTKWRLCEEREICSTLTWTSAIVQWRTCWCIRVFLRWRENITFTNAYLLNRLLWYHMKEETSISCIFYEKVIAYSEESVAIQWLPDYFSPYYLNAAAWKKYDGVEEISRSRREEVYSTSLPANRIRYCNAWDLFITV